MYLLPAFFVKTVCVSLPQIHRLSTRYFDIVYTDQHGITLFANNLLIDL